MAMSTGEDAFAEESVGGDRDGVSDIAAQEASGKTGTMVQPTVTCMSHLPERTCDAAGTGETPMRRNYVVHRALADDCLTAVDSVTVGRRQIVQHMRLPI